MLCTTICDVLKRLILSRHNVMITKPLLVCREIRRTAPKQFLEPIVSTEHRRRETAEEGFEANSSIAHIALLLCKKFEETEKRPSGANTNRSIDIGTLHMCHRAQAGGVVESTHKMDLHNYRTILIHNMICQLKDSSLVLINRLHSRRLATI